MHLLAIAVAVGGLVSAHAQNCARTSVGFTPLVDLGTGTFGDSMGGLYPGGSNEIPAAHLAGGIAQRDLIQPLDANGNPSPTGRIVLISTGMSNWTAPFSTFIQRIGNNKNSRLTIVDLAQGGKVATNWITPGDSTWIVAMRRLANAGVTPAQVQAVISKHEVPRATGGANARPWPDNPNDLRAWLGQIARMCKDSFPNLRLSFWVSRIYAGYATIELNPEPYAYRSGFGVKWAIRDQINGAANLNYDPLRGAVEAPWMGWGPYLWADGTTPRSDGLTWQCTDFVTDGTHPSQAGRDKTAGILETFFRTNVLTASWFNASGTGTTAPGIQQPARIHAPGRAELRIRAGVEQSPSADAVTDEARFSLRGQVLRSAPLIAGQ